MRVKTVKKSTVEVETISEYGQDVRAAQADKEALAKVRVLAYVNGSRATGYTLVVIKSAAEKAKQELEKLRA